MKNNDLIYNENPYLYFDDIICINLETRVDRLEYATDIFNKLSIPVRFYTAKKSIKGSIYGCFESHINIITEAYNNNKNNILIFEDDIIPTETYNIKHIKNAINFMKNNYWDIFYLGYFPINNLQDGDNNLNNRLFINSKRISSNIVKYNPYATHSYCLNRIGMKIILNNYKNFIEKNIHVDIFYSDHIILQSYCYIPMLFEQNFAIGTDIVAANNNEFAAKQISVILNDLQVNWCVSLLKYYQNIIIFFLVIVIILFILIIIKCK